MLNVKFSLHKTFEMFYVKTQIVIENRFFIALVFGPGINCPGRFAKLMSWKEPKLKRARGSVGHDSAQNEFKLKLLWTSIYTSSVALISDPWIGELKDGLYQT